MSLLNKLFKTKDKQQAALPVVTRESPKVAAASREPSSVFFYHNTNKTEECKMMKKIFVFVMLMVFAFSLTACSGTATPSTEKDSVTIQEWLDNEGSEADTTMTVTIVAIENPVWALVTDSSGAEVHLFGVMVDGEHKAFEEVGISEGDTIVISGGKYNEFEGNVEIAEATLVEIKQ